MKNSLENNLKAWNSDYPWSQDGDEWQGQAAYCGVDYEYWKNSLADHLLFPYLNKDARVLEIAPGHGRWSTLMIPRVKELILVDLGDNNIEFCKARFKDFDHIQYIVNDGSSLPGVANNSLDLVWSYDSFVHMEPSIVESYIQEIGRVLKPSGKAIIHHAGRFHFTLFLGFLKNWGKLGLHLYKAISMGRLHDTDGWRSNVSREMVRGFAQKSQLKVNWQKRFWQDGQIGVPRFNDCITELEKPH
jgi:ubiquinone/menaquinone biosynthesis C-methylase UbiE